MVNEKAFLGKTNLIYWFTGGSENIKPKIKYKLNIYDAIYNLNTFPEISKFSSSTLTLQLSRNKNAFSVFLYLFSNVLWITDLHQQLQASDCLVENRLRTPLSTLGVFSHQKLSIITPLITFLYLVTILYDIEPNHILLLFSFFLIQFLSYLRKLDWELADLLSSKGGDQQHRVWLETCD